MARKGAQGLPLVVLQSAPWDLGLGLIRPLSVQAQQLLPVWMPEGSVRCRCGRGAVSLEPSFEDPGMGGLDAWGLESSTGEGRQDECCSPLQGGHRDEHVALTARIHSTLFEALPQAEEGHLHHPTVARGVKKGQEVESAWHRAGKS